MLPASCRTGIGHDTHRLVKDRKLILGGVLLDHHLGLLGHSDADVLTHAVCDALLGAAGLGDIGELYPDSDPKFKDVSSLVLLGDVGKRLSDKGFSIVNIDATVFAEAPKLGPHKKKMVENIAKALNIETDKVNVKATTGEGLGIIGRQEAISAMAIVLISSQTS